MNNDSPPGSTRPAAGGEFTWPPTREELDAIDVIPLDDTSSITPTAVVPKAMAAPAVARRGRLRLPLRLPRRDDLVFGGAIFSSALAIAVAASMQFSDLWHPAAERRDPPIPPLIAQTLPATLPIVATAPIAMSSIVMSPIVTSPVTPVPVATRHVERRRVSARPAAKHVRRTAIAAPSMRLVSRHEDYVGPRLISPERGRSGKLVLLVEVRKNGKVGDVNVLSSNLDRENRSHRDLQRATISTVKRWRYTPAIRDGEPADTQVRVVVNIDLASGVIGPAIEADARRRATAANRVADSVRAAR
jgi:TonB family protein